MTEGEILFAAVRLSEVGVILVGILFVAAALGKWKKHLAFRVMVRSCVAGGLIPFAVYPISMLIGAHSLNARNIFERFVVVLWPSSIGLLGLDGPGAIILKLMFVAVLILMNMGLYGLIGVCIGFVCQRFRFKGAMISGGDI
jgi:hypothetical protein